MKWSIAKREEKNSPGDFNLTMIYSKCVTLSERNLNDNISCDQTTFNSNEMIPTPAECYNKNEKKKTGRKKH